MIFLYRVLHGNYKWDLTVEQTNRCSLILVIIYNSCTVTHLQKYKPWLDAGVFDLVGKPFIAFLFRFKSLVGRACLVYIFFCKK